MFSASQSPLLPPRRERHPGRGGDQLQQVHAPEVGGVRVYLVTRHVSSTDESRGRLQPPTQHGARGTCISSSLRTSQTVAVLHFNPDDTLVINARIVGWLNLCNVFDPEYLSILLKIFDSF